MSWSPGPGPRTAKVPESRSTVNGETEPALSTRDALAYKFVPVGSRASPVKVSLPPGSEIWLANANVPESSIPNDVTVGGTEKGVDPPTNRKFDFRSTTISCARLLKAMGAENGVRAPVLVSIWKVSRLETVQQGFSMA